MYFKDKKLLLTVGPLQSTIAYTINAVGFYYGYWDVYPFGNQVIVHVLFDIGIYPALSVWMIYFIKRCKINAFVLILIFAIATTIIEGLGIMIGRITYGHGWNIGLTFISYLIPYLLNYWYYVCMKRFGL